MTATEARCSEVWHSYGVTTEVLAWLPVGQATDMQRLNLFWYHKAISRVKTRFKVAGEPIIFGTQDDILRIYDPVSKRALKELKNDIDFVHADVIQVGRDLYALKLVLFDFHTD